MTIAAIISLCVLAVLPVALATITRRHEITPLVCAAGATLIVLSASAVTAGIAGPAEGVGAHVAQCAAVVAAITGGGAVVRTLLVLGGVDPWRSENGVRAAGVPGADHEVSSGPGSAQMATPQGAAPPTPLRGGRVIGHLERGAVAATLVIGWPEGLAIILAVKGLARYPELREAHVGEQFIIGTFGSVLYAVAVAGTAHLITS